MKSGLGARDSRLGTSVVVQAFRPAVLLAVLLSFATLSAQKASRKEDVNRRNVDGSTPLQWAVYDGDVAEARRRL